MADYRLDCCGGFQSHKSGCPQIQVESDHAREIENEVDQRSFHWRQFFSKMTKEEVFAYASKEDVAFKKAQVHKNRFNQALRHMRDDGSIMEYIDWSRRNV